jgi:ketopantoate reductase
VAKTAKQGIDKARVLVIGAGVNGSICAVERFEAIKREGIVIEDALRGTRLAMPVPVIDALAPDDRYEYILVVVRKNQVPGLLPALAANASPNVVFMANDPTGSADFVAGLKAESSQDMEDFLATHALPVPLIGLLALKFGCDTRALARSREDLYLFAEALGESMSVLAAVGRRIVPRSNGWVRHLPLFVIVAVFRMLLRSRVGEVGLGWHCSQAPDEIRELAREVVALVEKSGLPVPAMRKILSEA